MNKIKPRFKRFEVHGNLPVTLQLWYCGKCIDKQTKPKRCIWIEKYAKQNLQDADGGVIMVNANTQRNANNIQENK